MEPSVFIFFILLLIPGFWLIFSVRNLIKQRERLDDSYRIEQERIKSLTQRRRISRRPVQDHEETHVKEASPAVASVNSDAQTLDSLQNLNDAQPGAALESFLMPETPSSDIFTTSQVNEAFEKFMVDLPMTTSSS